MESMIKDVFNLPQDAKIEMVGGVQGIPGIQAAFGVMPGVQQPGKKGSALSQFCTNLNEEAKAGRIDRLECSSEFVVNRFRDDLAALARMYGGDGDAVQ